MIRTTKPHLVAYNGFCNKCSIIDPLLKRPIRDFVEGCFDLSLWANMVSWPLRSSQQITTGTSVISLGGLGSYNGTITGTVSHSADGIVFTAANNAIISTPIIFNDTADRFLFISCKPTVSQGSFVVGESGLSPSFVTITGTKTAILPNPGTIDPLSNVAINEQIMLGFSANATTVTAFQNAATTASASGAIAAQSSGIVVGRASNNNANFTGNVSVLIAGKGNTFDLAKYQSLYSLYKSTLGVGLGLP